jgi:2-polyprenyl-3-methyl-5-hydroxy-6-metoxy-1,4-benzoquinol methylase
MTKSRANKFWRLPKMNLDYYNLHGISLLDFLNGDTSATILIHNDSGEQIPVPVSLFFRNPADWPLDKKAIELSRGRVLDLGAGSGGHSLALQERGLNVVAIDFLPECVEVMKRRGVKQARHVDIFAFEADPFDTIISMMNGLALVEGLGGLQAFLKRLERLLKPGGQFLVDSTDLKLAATPERRSKLEQKIKEGRYYGEMELRMEYKGRKGPHFLQLYIDPETLAEQASAIGWRSEVILMEESGRFLARLTTAQATI